jgi:hypothetical protein
MKEFFVYQIYPFYYRRKLCINMKNRLCVHTEKLLLRISIKKFMFILFNEYINCSGR